MLLHLPTQYILYYAWDENGNNLIEATFKNHPELKTEDWCEIHGKTLKEKALRHYPDIIPIFNNGELIDIELPIKERKKKEEFKVARQKELEEHGYSKMFWRRKLRNNMFDFASDIFNEKIEQLMRDSHNSYRKRR